MARTTLEHITKVFTDDNANEIVAVDDVSIEIEDGEFLVLVGPSGCGKSTTLRMVAGLETITDGRIRLDDRVINDLPAQDRDIAMVFQSYALYPHMTVRGNMAFGLEESTDLPDEEIDALVTETAEMLGIEGMLDRTPDELSGGQQQRVALGRAIVRDPDVFLMDEPLSNLDAKLRSQMRMELQRLQEGLETTTIYVTHDQTEAMTMGDRIAVLNDGKLQQVGTPLECYHRPANLFVAGFIGEPSMNTIRGTIDNDEIVTDEFTYPISADLAAELEGVSDVTLGIRPEDLELSTEKPEDSRALSMIVDVVEPMGDENVVYLRFDSGDVGIDDDQLVLIATIDGISDIADTETVWVRIPEEAVHVFSTESGRAIRNRRLEGDAERVV